jgi:hypothetical protein
MQARGYIYRYTYVNAGKSSNLAWNWKNCVNTFSLSSDVAVAMAAASVVPNAATLSTKSMMARLRRRPPAPERSSTGSPPSLRGAAALLVPCMSTMVAAGSPVFMMLRSLLRWLAAASIVNCWCCCSCYVCMHCKCQQYIHPSTHGAGHLVYSPVRQDTSLFLLMMEPVLLLVLLLLLEEWSCCSPAWFDEDDELNTRSGCSYPAPAFA